MSKRIAILFLVLLSAASQAREQNILDTVSPKLKKLLTDKPSAYSALTNALAQTFSTNTVRLYYFYSADESEPRTFHYYPNTGGLADVFICLRENQTPLDEFLCLLFEIFNAQGQNRFAMLCEKAIAGTISRNEFSKEILKVELEAIQKTKAVATPLKLTKKETADSDDYRRFVECPAEFDDYLVYIKKISPHRDARKEYELKYDWLRKTSEDSALQTNSVAPRNGN